MLKVIPEAQKVEIVENVVAAVKDITKLNKVGYDFINLASGFIAHYNLNGFISHYEDYSLKDDILSNARQNQWNNFHKGEANYDYYMSKKDVYNRIVAGIESDKIHTDFIFGRNGSTGSGKAFSFNQIDLFAGVDLDLS